MNHDAVQNGIQNTLLATLQRWQYMAPCLGTQVSLWSEVTGLWHGVAGYESLEPLVPFKAQSTTYSYSITKVFVAFCILKSVEQGLCALDDAVGEYLRGDAPGYKLSESITVRALLGHRTTLKNYTALKNYPAAVKKHPHLAWSETEFVAQLPWQDAEATENFVYNNTGYYLLRKLLEALHDASFDEVLQHMVCEPLGLRHTRAVTTAGQTLPGYTRDLHPEHIMENMADHYDPKWCYTGLVASTPEDVVLFYQALFKGNLLSAPLLKHMLTHRSIGHAAPFFENPGYGLGVMIDLDASGQCRLMGHGGSGPGFNTWSAYYPQAEVILCIFCNTEMANHPFYLAQDLLRVCLNEPLP